MANRFQSIVLNNPQTDEDGVDYLGTVVIRPATDGLTDLEFDNKCRVIHYDMPSKVYLEELLSSMGYKVLDSDAWSSMLNNLDDPKTIQTDFFIYPHKKDKWDGEVTIY